MNTEEVILSEDRYSIPTYKKLPIALVKGEGAYVWDAEGNRYLDFYGGHCVALLGHCPPRVVEAIRRQSETLLFYSNVVYSDVRARTAKLLASMVPQGLGNIFFCNSGTEAVETALKIARKATGRQGIIAMEGDFHGRTLGSLATTWNSSYRAPYSTVLPHTHFVPFGNPDRVIDIINQHGNIAAVFLEPIQSIAGMVQAPAEYYQELRKICDQAGALLIFDEVQTGVGRTGTFSVSEQYGMVPDVITLAKSLGSGVPVGATLIDDKFVPGIQYGDQGSTFGGGMLAMRAVESTLLTIQEGGLMNRARVIFSDILDAAAPHVRSIRGRGCLIGLDCGGPAVPILTGLREQGILAGGSSDSNVIRLMPPLITTSEHIKQFADALQIACMKAKLNAV